METVCNTLKQAHELAAAGMKRRAATVFQSVIGSDAASEEEREQAARAVERLTETTRQNVTRAAAKERNSAQRRAARQRVKFATEKAEKARQGDLITRSYNGTASAEHMQRANQTAAAYHQREAEAAAARLVALDKQAQEYAAFVRVVAAWDDAGMNAQQIATVTKRGLSSVRKALQEIKGGANVYA
ncbi:hypothetical protein J3169_004409 [Salmonella enterica]|nr:hypothetical protein [Salmonella enterica]